MTDLEGLEELTNEQEADSDEEEADEEEDEEEADDDEEEAATCKVKVRNTTEAAKGAAADADGEVASATGEPAGAASKLANGLKAALGIKKPAAKAAPAAPVTKPKTEREVVIEQLDAAEQNIEETNYELPPLELLLPNEEVVYEEQEKEVRRKAKILEKTFRDFGFNVKVVEIETGPVIAQFEVELEAGLRLSKITSLADDLAIALRVPSVRIVPRFPARTPSASKCRTKSGNSFASAK